MGVLREVVQMPHPLLSVPCFEVGGIDGSVEELIEDLIESMRGSPGCVGLAANQIGSRHRVLVVDVTEHPKADSTHGLVVIMNPVVLSASNSEVQREGCMSVPHLTVDVKRSSKVVVEGLGWSGEPLEMLFQGFEARAVLHEIDHLNGYLIIDRAVSPAAVFKRKRYR